MAPKILVTGAAGFIGSHLVDLLLERHKDARVLSYDALTYAGNIENLSDAAKNPRHRFVHGDIGDAGLVRQTLESFEPDVIVHTAAETHVDRSIASPAPFIKTNVENHAILLDTVTQWLKKSGKKDFRFLHISTDEVFGSLSEEDAPFSEDSPYHPRSPYSASKAASDHFSRAWHHTYGLPVIVMNASNNFGPRQYPEKLIPFMITQALRGKDLPVYGNGKNIRDWLYVRDFCAAIEAVMLRGKIGETYAIGGANEYRNIEIVEKLCGYLDGIAPRTDGKSYKAKITYITDRPGHDWRYALDSAKAKRELGWAPGTSFDDALRATAEWFVKEYGQQNAAE